MSVFMDDSGLGIWTVILVGRDPRPLCVENRANNEVGTMRFWDLLSR